MKKYLGALFLLWTGVLIAVYYVVQKPGLISTSTGLLDTLWTLLVAGILLFNAYGLGKRILSFIKFDTPDPVEHLLLGWGIGLGALGLLGLFFSVAQLAHEAFLAIVQWSLAVFFLLRNDVQQLRSDFRSLRAQLNISFNQYSYFTRVVIGTTLLFAFLLTLAPPFEAFDVLINHLAQPATVLQHGGLQAVNILPYWYPTLTESVYLWALAMDSERAAQMLHLAWGILAVLMLWHWSTRVWGTEIGRKTLLLVTAIPSLVMLASWAYVDMALCYYAVAALYTLTLNREWKSGFPLTITAILSGMAMGVKYQSFTIPLTCGLILLFERPIIKRFCSAFRFSLITLLIALPWYLRNAIFMGNPFYPFLFGGRYWDDFLAKWWTEAGTGIGWNLSQILMLPVNITLGYRDVTYFDGRFGPLYLLLLPMALWVLIFPGLQDSAKRFSLVSIGCFTALNFAAWTIGVINTSALWQARYLFPAVMAFSIPTALGWEAVHALDTARLKVSFLVDTLIGLVLLLIVVDNGIFVIQRNPLSVALGIQSREQYIARVNPSYAALMSLMDQLPAKGRVYNLFEPRSYGLSQPVQPDVINSNFAHDAYLYKTPEEIIQHWKSEQYTHVLVYERGLDFLSDTASYKFTPATQKILEETLGRLTLVGQTPDKVYSLYKIP